MNLSEKKLSYIEGFGFGDVFSRKTWEDDVYNKGLRQAYDKGVKPVGDVLGDKNTWSSIGKGFEDLGKTVWDELGGLKDILGEYWKYVEWFFIIIIAIFIFSKIVKPIYKLVFK